MQPFPSDVGVVSIVYFLPFVSWIVDGTNWTPLWETLIISDFQSVLFDRVDKLHPVRTAVVIVRIIKERKFFIEKKIITKKLHSKNDTTERKQRSYYA